MPCKLCLRDLPLCASHIIPEFFYEGGYDHKHRALELTRDQGTQRFVQKGYREALLCNDCEGRFNQFETHFKKQWYDDSILPSRLDAPLYKATGLDYRLTKLLHLSILWRASVSSHPMFRNVALGPHEEIIRGMLLSDEPGDVGRYQSVGRVLVLEGDVVDGLIIEPTPDKFHGRHVYMFTYGGCAWYFVASKHPIQVWLPLALQLDGSQVLARQQVTKDRIISDFLVDFLRRKEAS